MTRILEEGALTRQQFAFDGSIDVDVYDLMYHDGDDVKPFSSLADQLTEEANQQYAAERFAGLAMKTLTTEQTAADANFSVATDCVVSMTCASATFEKGDFVGPCEDSGADGLENQKVKKVDDFNLAIGVVTKRYASATTTVEFRAMSRVVPHAILNPNASNGFTKVTTANATDTATLTAAQLLAGVISGVPTAAASYTLPTAALMVAAINRPKVGDSFDFLISNNSAGANTITVLAGGATLDGTVTVAQNVVRLFRVVLTNVTAAAEAYTVYGVG